MLSVVWQLLPAQVPVLLLQVLLEQFPVSQVPLALWQVPVVQVPVLLFTEPSPVLFVQALLGQVLLASQVLFWFAVPR